MSDIEEALKLREKYTHFRILVIGRANAGKTTLLKRVCNTDEDPCIYDENNDNQLTPTEERGIHDIERQFAFRSNPQFIFHDSPGFETGDEKQLQAVRSFIEKRSKARNPNEQLHAIWFCFVLNASRPLLELEQQFFGEQRAGNIPVIAIFTKFDDLVTQIYDRDKDYDENEAMAKEVVEQEFRLPLTKFSYGPKAYVRFEALDDDEGDYQEQVKVLIDETAFSLDGLALKMLFVSVQQNNLEICIRNAIHYTNISWEVGDTNGLVWATAAWFGHCYQPVDYGEEMIEIGRRDRIDIIIDRRRIRLATDSIMEAINNSNWHDSAIYTMTALVICLENSFWRDSQNFQTAFKESWNFYIHSDARKRVEQELSAAMPVEFQIALRAWRGRPNLTEGQKKEFSEIVCRNLLPRPDTQLSV